MTEEELWQLVSELEKRIDYLQAEFEGAKDELLHVHRILLPYLIQERDQNNGDNTTQAR